MKECKTVGRPENIFALSWCTCGSVQLVLLRGLDKVKHEWRRACTAFNLGKLVRHLAPLRAERAEPAAANEI